MTKGLRALVGIVLIFSLLLSGVGYATLTDSLQVTGSANAEAPESVFVYELSNPSGFTNIEYIGSIIKASSVTFDASGKATVEVSVMNNTLEEFMYYGVNTTPASNPGYTAVVTDPNKVETGNKLDTDGTQYIVAIDGNESAGTSARTGAKIANGTKHAKLLLTLTGTPNATVNEVYLSLHYVQSSFHNGWVKVSGALAQFEAILNDIGEGGKMETMLGALESKSESNNGDPSYMGNVAGGSSTTNEVIANLFKDSSGKNMLEQMDLNNDGVNDIITIMIKAQDLDGNEDTGIDIIDQKTTGWFESDKSVYGAEMTLYITPALLGTQLDAEGNEVSYVDNGDYVVVYAANFILETQSDGTQKWVMLPGGKDGLLSGVCQVVAYSGWGGNDSFNTSTWRSTEEYFGVSAAYSLPPQGEYDYTKAIEGGTSSGSANLQAIFTNQLAEYNASKG